LPDDLNFNGQKAATFLGGAIVTNSWVLNSVRVMCVVKVHDAVHVVWQCPKYNAYDAYKLTLYRSLMIALMGICCATMIVIVLTLCDAS